MPQSDNAALEAFELKYLLEVKTDSLYKVHKLRYSRLYIPAKGLLFINDLARSYYFKCLTDTLKYIPFTISSLTRSKQSVSDLVDNNANAVLNNAHLRSKTFDISYRTFYKDVLK
ncbi:DUF5715 family protein [Arcticibacter svalbardensis]|uniref:DUF5715 family protein n=1 Tax=Arcticibacter svalbardensis TaxID=1288027 RepID=UPI000590B520|nr:DUF5715 family protein [Arcticibacter svalbardensis]